MKRIQIEFVGHVTFKLIYDSGIAEYRIRVYENGHANNERTYFTDNKSDALLTLKAMVKEENQNQNIS